MATGRVTVETLFFSEACAQWHLPALGHGILFTLTGESRVLLPARAHTSSDKDQENKEQEERTAVTEALSAFVQECSLDVCGDAPWAAVPAGATTLAKLSVLPLPVRACFAGLTLDALDASKASTSSSATARFTLRLVVGRPTQTPFAFKHQTARRYLAALCADPVGRQPFAIDVRRRMRSAAPSQNPSGEQEKDAERRPMRNATVCSVVTDAAQLLSALDAGGAAPFTTPEAQAAARTAAGRAALVRRPPRSRTADALAVLRWLCCPILFAAACTTLAVVSTRGVPSAIPVPPPFQQQEVQVQQVEGVSALQVTTRAQAWALGAAENALAACDTDACASAALARAAEALGVAPGGVQRADLAALRAALPATEDSLLTTEEGRLVRVAVLTAGVAGLLLLVLHNAAVQRCVGRAVKALWRAARPAVRWAHDRAVLEAAAYAAALDLVAAGARHGARRGGALVAALGVAAAVPCFLYSTVLHGCAPAVLRCVSHRAALRAVLAAWLAACALPAALAARAPLLALAAFVSAVIALIYTLRALSVPLPFSSLIPRHPPPPSVSRHCP